VESISAQEAINWGLTGLTCGPPTCPGTGKAEPYSGCENYEFIVPTGKNGDVYDRYMVRMMEVRQSNEIVRQVLEKMPGGAILADDPQVVYPPKDRVQESIEALIHHFHLASAGFPTPAGEVYASIESPKGELGFYLVRRNEKPWFRVRPPLSST
jgi:NADH-quinone oxidoreductase subunit D